MRRYGDELSVCSIAAFADHRIRDALAAEPSGACFAAAAADTGVDCDSLSGLQSGDIPANFANDSGCIAAHDLRHWNFHSGHAAAEKNVDVIDGCGLDLDQDIRGAK